MRGNSHDGFGGRPCGKGPTTLAPRRTVDPTRSLQETFLPEVEVDGAPVDLDDLNRRARVWLDERVHAVESRTTGEAPAARLVVEREFLSGLPATRFDTDYVEVRRVHDVSPFVSIDTNRYSVPPEALGHKVEIRRTVDADTVEIRLAGRFIATHRLVAGRRVDVWNPEHRRAAEALALGHSSGPDRPGLRLVTARSDQDPAPAERLDLGGDYDVAEVDLGGRYAITINNHDDNDNDGEVSA